MKKEIILLATILFAITLTAISLFISSVSACQYSKIQSYQEPEWGLYNSSGSYMGLPLEFKDFVIGEHDRKGCINAPSFKVNNTLDLEITINISYISYWSKPPIYTDKPTMHNEVISINKNADSNFLTGDCRDRGNGSIKNDSIKYIIISPQIITLEYKNVTKSREVCSKCGSGDCLDDGVTCNPLTDDRRCGSGICNIAGVCGDVKITDCPPDFSNCNDKICLTPGAKDTGEKYLCEWECKGTDRFENNTCLKSSLSIELTSWPNEGDVIFFNFIPSEDNGNNEMPFQYRFTNSSEIDYCLLYIDDNIAGTSDDGYGGNDFQNWIDAGFDFNLAEGNHTWKVYCTYSSGLYSYSETRTFYAEDFMLSAPVIYLTWPNENQIFNLDDNVSLEFLYFNNSELTNCSQIVDGMVSWVWDLLTWENIGYIQLTDPGKHTWSYTCTNVYGRIGYSMNRTFYRLKENIIPYNLNLAYLSADDSLSNITGLSIFSFVGQENSFAGIQFIDNINLSRDANLSDFISISENNVFLDSVKAPWLNKKAKITFENLKFTNPCILKDGTPIDLSFTYTDGTLTFIVDGFSLYSIEESTAPPSGGGGSGGGGGGGSSAKKAVNNTALTNNTNMTIPLNENKTAPIEHLSITNNETGENNVGDRNGQNANTHNLFNKWIISLFILIAVIFIVVIYINAGRSGNGDMSKADKPLNNRNTSRITIRG